MANLNWETPSERDTFKNDLQAKLERVSCYHKEVSHGEDREGNPRSTVDCRSEKTPDADGLYAFIRDRMDKIPALKGRITVHDCKHDEGPPFEPCVVEKEYEVR